MSAAPKHGATSERIWRQRVRRKSAPVPFRGNGGIRSARNEGENGPPSHPTPQRRDGRGASQRQGPRRDGLPSGSRRTRKRGGTAGRRKEKDPQPSPTVHFPEARSPERGRRRDRRPRRSRSRPSHPWRTDRPWPNRWRKETKPQGRKREARERRRPWQEGPQTTPIPGAPRGGGERGSPSCPSWERPYPENDAKATRRSFCLSPGQLKV